MSDETTIREPKAGPNRGPLRRRIADAYFAWRNRTVASPRFQRWAASFPLTRPVAQRQARALFDLVAGFVYSQILQACVTLDVFVMLKDGPLPATDLARRFDLPLDATLRLLDAAVAIDLLAKRGREGDDRRYGLGMLGAALRGNPGVSAMVAHHRLLYDDLADPVMLLRNGGAGSALSQYWAYARTADSSELRPDATTPYSALMSASQGLVADEIIAAYPFASHRRMLDVGGGDGTFLETVAQTVPALDVVLFDLEPVAALARQRFDAATLGPRAVAVGGDFKTDALPGGADLISLVRVAYDHDDAFVARLLRRVFEALEPGGTIVIAEPMADAPGARAMGDAYFGFYLLAMGGGRPRSAATHCALLAHAGFVDARPLRTRRPMLTSLVSARRPS